MGRVTSADVARAAGVSRTTVSYILNDKPNKNISIATREKVRKAVEQLNYAPSTAARVLRGDRSNIVLHLFPDWPLGPVIGDGLKLMTAAFAKRGLTLITYTMSGAGADISSLWAQIAPSAVLIYEELFPEETARMRAAGIEVVMALTDSAAGESNKQVLLNGEALAGQLQAEHLLQRGHRQLGYAFPADVRIRSFANTRLEAVRAVCVAHGVPAPIVQTLSMAEGGSADAMAAWRLGNAQEGPVTGICAYDDELALAVLAAVRKCGLHVPEDLAIVGVGDIPTAVLADPPLTTVAHDYAVMADYVADWVVSALSGKRKPPPLGDDVARLIFRKST